MKFIFLIGNTSVGKMSVGQELVKITNLKLFHNHMMIEPVMEILGHFDGEVIAQLRETIFKAFAKTNHEGLTFTFMWAFDQQSDWDYIEKITQFFPYDTDFYYVELVAPQEIRLARNKTENRLQHKASKRKLAVSEQLLLDSDKNYRCESYPGEINFKNYLKIDNSQLSPFEAAQQIKDTFSL